MSEGRESAALRVWRAHPMVRFAVLGVGLFALDRWRHPPARGGGRSDIVLSRDFVASLRAGLGRERGRAPTDAELEARLQEHVRDEALYRGALAMGLDRGDGIIRRRLVQKANYLLESEAEPGTPAEAELRGWYDAHRERYQASARVDFEHRLFSGDRRGARAADDARRALAAGVVEGAGDPFLRGERFVGVGAAEVAGAFGEGFAAALAGAPLGRWSGPIASAHGQHLVRVTARREAAAASFEGAREAATRDWRDAERARRLEAAARAWVAGYRVVRE